MGDEMVVMAVMSIMDCTAGTTSFGDSDETNNPCVHLLSA